MYIESKDINSISWSAEIDLLADLEKLAEARLNEFGITRDISKEASVQFVSYSFREISSNPKMLFQSKEFTCPSGYENAFNTVCRKIAEGEDLSPFFSRRYDDPSFSDYLFNDWHIYHFHLSDQYDSDGKARRSGYLLFAYINSDAAYLIQIYPHSESDVFAKTDMLRIISCNWPNLISRYEFSGKAIHTFSDSAINEMRKHNINVITEINPGKGLLPIGGGSSTDGSPTEAITYLLKLQRKLANCQELIINNTEEILKSLIEHKSGSVNYDLTYELIGIDSLDKKFIVHERSNSIQIIIEWDNLDSLLIEPIAD
ncbi:MAG: hypothetical protein PQJ48_08625 [Sphaerochaetaceae bacterium]|nr:hypothetical protein [Sphaerochaetaceae bacterium]